MIWPARRPMSWPVYCLRGLSMIESNQLAVELGSARPPAVAPLRQAVRGATKRRRAAPVFAVTSRKGGGGKTNVVANVAIALAGRQRRAMIIDADFGAS